jgi:hypothetical protein
MEQLQYMLCELFQSINHMVSCTFVEVLKLRCCDYLKLIVYHSFLLLLVFLFLKK